MNKRMIMPITGKPLESYPIKDAKDIILFNKEHSDYLVNRAGCFRGFEDAFRNTPFFDDYLFQDNLKASILKGNIIVDGVGWVCSYEVGEFDVLTEHSIVANKVRYLNREEEYNPKIKHKLIKGIKFIVPFMDKKNRHVNTCKLFFVPYKINEMSNKFNMNYMNWYSIYFNEVGDKSITNFKNNLKQKDSYVDASICSVILYCETQKQALKQRERVERERSLPAKQRSQNKPKNNNDGTYTVNLSKDIQFIYEKSNVHRDVIWKCEAWNVRGHYRHCKNGKIIFVRPYVKGKGRLNEKTYIIKGV